MSCAQCAMCQMKCTSYESCTEGPTILDTIFVRHDTDLPSRAQKIILSFLKRAEPPDLGSKITVTYSRLHDCVVYTNYVRLDLATRAMRTKHVHNLRAQSAANCAN